jgi:hypothetical protein
MSHQLVRKRSSSSLPGKQSEVGIPTTPSDQLPREAKSVWYNRPSYIIVLVTKGSFIAEFKLVIIKGSNEGYQALLNAE